ncbi:hypothetical protein [Deinococcus sp.]|uniref:hypothetical protein n=1 Tax=Deinococcus sp. TaxID=47478 RepID=UPI003B5C9448
MTLLASPQAASVGLRWTNNYMMDMAVAGLLAFCHKADLPGVDINDLPAQLTADDLKTFQTWAEQHYFAPELTSWISVVFTSNFLNPSFTLEKKKEVLREILTSYQRPNLLGVPCAFFPELPAQQRVARDLLPMLMGRGPMNFYPDGQPGLPLSGLAITALHGLSVAAPLVSGRALLVDADDHALLLEVAGQWVGELRTRAELSLMKKERLAIWAAARTRLVEALREVMKKRHLVNQTVAGHTGSATIYHLSNSGQGPDIQIYTLTQPAIAFLELAERNFKAEWKALTSAASQPADKGKDEQHGTRNNLDEALLSLPDNAQNFLRRFLMPPFRHTVFLPEPKRSKKDKKTDASQVAAPEPLNLARVWGLSALFLREVVGMDKGRIKAIEELGDRLGDWIVEENDMPLFRSLYEARGAGPLRHLLLKATLNKAKKDAASGMSKDDQDLLITDDAYLKVFMEADEVARADFTLARDLLKMRVIQRLHAADLFNKNKGNPVLQQIELTDEQGDQ